MLADENLMGMDSPRQPAPTTPEAFFEHLVGLRQNFDLLDSLEAGDWQKARHLLENGADLFFHDFSTFMALERHGTKEAYDLLLDFLPERIRTPFCLKFAAACGEESWVVDLLRNHKHEIDPEDVHDAVSIQLERKDGKVFRPLINALIPAFLNDGILTELAVRDFPLYVQKAREHGSSEINLHFSYAVRNGHFTAARNILDQLDENTPPFTPEKILSTGMDLVVGLHGNAALLDHYLNLRNRAPETLPNLLEGIIRADNIALAKHLVPDAAAVSTPLGKQLAVMAGKRNMDVDIISHFLTLNPDAVIPYIRDDEMFLSTCLCRKNGDELFFNALKKGIILHEVTGAFLVDALENNAPKASAFLLSIMKKSSAPTQIHTLQIMQQTDSYAVLRGAMELGGHAVFGDRIFWEAARERDLPTMLLFRDDRKIPAAADDTLAGLQDFFRNEDNKEMSATLLDAVFERIAWSEELCAEVLPDALSNPDILERLLQKGLHARHIWPNITEENKAFSGTQGVRALLLLEEHGFSLPDVLDLAQLALIRNDTAILDYALNKGLNPLESHTSLSLREIDADNADILLKWSARYKTEAIEDILPLIDTQHIDPSALNAESIIITAAKAGVFPVLLDKWAAEKTPLSTATLLTLNDGYGNTLLDILGVHGQLNTLLRPALWLDQNPVPFLMEHTHPLYLSQYDFTTFQATRNLTVLKHKAAPLRFKGFNP